MKQRALLILLIVAAAFAVYAPSLANGFVWDDQALIQRDPFIRSWRSMLVPSSTDLVLILYHPSRILPEGFRHFLFTNATASNFYRPIQRLTYTWDYAWCGFRPAIYHFDNILIHALAGVFLFLLVEQLLTVLGRARAREWAAVVAGIWVIHPLFTSAVCYISGRADPLAAMFGFCGLWLALRNGRASSALGAVMFFCALCSKESGAIFLPLCIALVMLVRFPRGVVIRWVVLSMLVVGAGLCMRLMADHIDPPAQAPMSLAARPIVALRAVAEYAGLFVAPVTLHMERDVLPFGRGDLAATLHSARNREFQTLLGAILLAGFIWWMVWARRRDRAVFVGLACFGIAYLPICGLFSLNASVAEHWLYVPAAFLILATLLSISRAPISRNAGIAVLAVWAIALGVRTFIRNADWHDQSTFLERTIADGGGSARMLINRGGLELNDGHIDLAIVDFKNALTLSPDQPFGLISLGSAYLRSKQFDLARQEFTRALDFPITTAQAAQDLAVVEYMQTGKDRMDLLQKAAAAAPDDWDIQKRYITHLGEVGQLKEAIINLRAIVADKPWQAEAWKMLGDLWLHVHQPDSAARAYQKAIALDVHDDETVRKLNAVVEQFPH